MIEIPQCFEFLGFCLFELFIVRKYPLLKHMFDSKLFPSKYSFLFWSWLDFGKKIIYFNKYVERNIPTSLARQIGF